jgi:hypothetical protein
VTYAAERWRTAHGKALRLWLFAIGEIEALLSLAAYSFDHPSDPFPEFVSGSTSFEAEELGHPLIPAEICVRNSVAVKGRRPRAAGERLEHVGQEHAAAVGGHERRAGDGRSSGQGEAITPDAAARRS